MIYPDNDIRFDSPLYIRELQLRLRDLSYLYDSVPRVEIDGIFGEETTNAVRAVQLLFSLPPTGTADLATWSALTAAHRSSEELRTPFPAEIFPSAFSVFSLGDSDPVVSVLQSMLVTLKDAHESFGQVSINGTVDKETAHAFSTLQELGQLPQTGAMDVATWNVLARLYNASA